MSTTIYHNPSCSKCRLTMELLHNKGEEPTVVEYLNSPPDANALTEILDLLKLEPRDLMRKHETEYLDNNLDDASLSREQLIAAMVKHPRLIERPIVITEHDGKRQAAIGRPPENVLDIL
ncbi:MAG: arsenate reductase (glutaredoxin) [Ectothiorhodospiraceae bacterium]|nr:arsenate reductase (glutaredoxin) [Ectothiorhodospiraceae bacterium]